MDGFDRKKFIQEWTTALRSGNFAQVQGVLRKGNSFCCLGVGCEVLGLEHGELDDNYQGADFSLPGNILEELDWTLDVHFELDKLSRELRRKLADFAREEDVRGSLMGLNDVNQVPFSIIADVIEEAEEKDAWVSVRESD